MGPGVLILVKSNSLGGSVCAWFLADSGRFLAKIARGLGFMSSIILVF